MLSLYAQLLALLLLPLLVAVVVASVWWQQLDRGVVFTVSLVATLYVLYGCICYITLPHFYGGVLQRVESGEGARRSPFIGEFWPQIALFLLAAVPVVWVLLKAFRRD